MHQAHTGLACFGQHLHGADVPERTHVVDDVHAQFDRRPHHRRLARIDRHRYAQRHRMAQHRQHPRQFFGCIGLASARPGRFAADIENVGALRQQVVAVTHGRICVAKAPAVGERVRRHVDDAHHQRALETQAESGRLPMHQ